jgi:hypothetical protein
MSKSPADGKAIDAGIYRCRLQVAGCNIHSSQYVHLIACVSADDRDVKLGEFHQI